MRESQVLDLDIVILAGGRGVRMGELTDSIPKPMLRVDGKPIIQHILNNIISAFGQEKRIRVIIVLGYKGNAIKEALGNQYGNIRIEYIDGPETILEPRKRLLLAESKIVTENFLYLAGDIICRPEQLRKVALLQMAASDTCLGALTGAVELGSAYSHAVLRTQNSVATAVEYPEKSESVPKDGLRDMQVACYARRFFEFLKNAPDEVLLISRVIAHAIEQGEKFQVSEYQGDWYHFHEPKDLEAKIYMDEKPFDHSSREGRKA